MSVRRAQFELSAVSGPVNCQTHSTTHTATETKHTHGTRTEHQQQWWWCVFCDEDAAAAAARLGPTSPSGKNRATTSTTAHKKKLTRTRGNSKRSTNALRNRSIESVRSGEAAGPIRRAPFSACVSVLCLFGFPSARALSGPAPSPPPPVAPFTTHATVCPCTHKPRVAGEETTASDAAGFRFRFPPKGP